MSPPPLYPGAQGSQSVGLPPTAQCCCCCSTHFCNVFFWFAFSAACLHHRRRGHKQQRGSSRIPRFGFFAPPAAPSSLLCGWEGRSRTTNYLFTRTFLPFSPTTCLCNDFCCFSMHHRHTGVFFSPLLLPSFLPHHHHRRPLLFFFPHHVLLVLCSLSLERAARGWCEAIRGEVALLTTHHHVRILGFLQSAVWSCAPHRQLRLFGLASERVPLLPFSPQKTREDGVFVWNTCTRRKQNATTIRYDPVFLQSALQSSPRSEQAESRTRGVFCAGVCVIEIAPPSLSLPFSPSINRYHLSFRGDFSHHHHNNGERRGRPHRRSLSRSIHATPRATPFVQRASAARSTVCVEQRSFESRFR